MGRHAARVPVVAGSLGVAKDQHQPASSRAIATLAMTGFFLRVVRSPYRRGTSVKLSSEPSALK
jgi:hypothetical protein